MKICLFIFQATKVHVSVKAPFKKIVFFMTVSKKKLAENDVPLCFISPGDRWFSEKKVIMRMFDDERRYFIFCDE